MQHVEEAWAGGTLQLQAIREAMLALVWKGCSFPRWSKGSHGSQYLSWKLKIYPRKMNSNLAFVQVSQVSYELFSLW